MTSPARLPDIKTVRNFRDMGGYEANDGRKTHWGTLFRSGHLAELDDTDRATLQGLKIGTVIDFRSDREKERHRVLWADPWKPVCHPNPIGGNAAAWVQELYDRLATSPFPAKDLRDQFILAFETIPVDNAVGLRRFFDALIDKGEGGALFHCTAGKDRTGIAGALLLTAMDVDKDQIMEDFMLTNDAVDLQASSERIAGWLSEKAGRTIKPADVHPLVGVEPDFLHAAYASIDRTFGGMEKYLEVEMGLTSARREKLCTLFLEG